MIEAAQNSVVGEDGKEIANESLDDGKELVFEEVSIKTPAMKFSLN